MCDLKSLLFEANFQSLEFHPACSTLQMESLNWSSVIRVSHRICTCIAATEFETSCKMVTNLSGRAAGERGTMSPLSLGRVSPAPPSR